MRANATGEDGVAVVQQVVHGDGGSRVLVAPGHVLRGLSGGDVLDTVRVR